MNASYHEVAKLAPLNGYKADLHELTITAEGTAIFSIYTQIRIMAFGRKIWIWDCIFQEVDIATNKLVFEWRASEHHSVEETYSGIGTGGKSKSSAWDWFHMNSVQKDELGNYFVSARYTRTLSYIDGQSGRLRWILGGKRNMFNDLSDGNGTDFVGQHFARMHELTIFPNMMSNEIKAFDKADDKRDRVQKLVTMFDNGASDRTRARDYSRGLVLQIEYPAKWQYVEEPEFRATKIQRDLEVREASFDGKLLAGHTVRLVQEYIHPEKISADSQGSMQIIPPRTPREDPHIGLGYGQRPVFTEYDADGRAVCDIQYVPKPSVEGARMQSYRAFKEVWIGQPLYPPAVNLSAELDAIYVSWNGATEVATWQLQHAAVPRSNYGWGPVIVATKKGFETKIDFNDHKLNRYIRVAAVNKNGETLGVSQVVDLGGQDVSIDPSSSSLRGMCLTTRQYLYAEDELNSTAASASASEVIAHFYLMTTPSMPLKLAMFALCAIAFVLTVYGCYRQYSNWLQTRRLGYNRLRTASDTPSDEMLARPARQDRWFGYDHAYRRDESGIGIEDTP